MFDTGARVVFRLSGTGTEGATIRVYLEAFTDDPARFGDTPETALSAIIDSAETLMPIKSATGRKGPDVTT